VISGELAAKLGALNLDLCISIYAILALNLIRTLFNRDLGLCASISSE
jgi:hypothetical protein